MPGIGQFLLRVPRIELFCICPNSLSGCFPCVQRCCLKNGPSPRNMEMEVLQCSTGQNSSSNRSSGRSIIFCLLAFSMISRHSSFVSFGIASLGKPSFLVFRDIGPIPAIEDQNIVKLFYNLLFFGLPLFPDNFNSPPRSIVWIVHPFLRGKFP